MKRRNQSVSVVASLLLAVLVPIASAGVPKAIVAEDFGATW